MSTMIVKPVISEKSMRLAAARQYVFIVPIAASKIEIAKSIAKLFKVDVINIRTITTPGKTKRFRGTTGRRVDIKKAIVTVKPGQSIKVFEAEEEAKADKKPKKSLSKGGK